MKKIKQIIVIFLIIIMPIQVKALYTNYSKLSEYSENCPLETELTKVYTQKRYKWEKKEFNYSDYILKYSDKENFPYVIEDDILETEFSSWQERKPDEVLNRITEVKKTYIVSKAKQVRYITFSAVKSNSMYYEIGEFEVFVSAKKVGYKILKVFNSTSGYGSYISDGNEHTVLKIKNPGYIKIDLNEYYPPNSITLRVRIKNELRNSHTFKFQIFEDTKTISSEKFFEFNEDDNEINVSALSFNVKDATFKEEEELDFKPDDSIYLKIKERTLYRYKDKLYKHYNINRKITENYFYEKPFGYDKKIESEYKQYCAYKTRSLKREKQVKKEGSKKLILPKIDENSDLSKEVKTEKIVKNISLARGNKKEKKDLLIKENKKREKIFLLGSLSLVLFGIVYIIFR